MAKYDEWLSSQIGFDAYHFDPAVLPENQLAKMTVADTWFGDVKIGVREPLKVATFTGFGFNLVDTNVQLTLKKSGSVNNQYLASCYSRFSTAQDEQLVRVIAANSFVHDRFHADPHIADETASNIKTNWAENFFTGKRGDWMVVAEIDGEIGGFLQLLASTDEKLVIDLIAVATSHQGKGLASDMIAFARENCLAGQDILVGTQLANVASLTLYQKLGFQIQSSSHMLHYHHIGTGK
jgi:ribosomal protein S18 acetylase RimI-like enzyme